MAMNMLRTKALQQVSKNSNKTLVKAMSSSSTPYTERQARLGRPVSPHVTIYKFPVNALTSITNRVTGVGLAGGIAAGSAVAFVGGDVPSIIYSLQDIVPGFAPLSKFFVAFPFTYHFLSAVRHVVSKMKS
jgi:succinate dehydrogenase (ubiquinone) cytochrome b560 subunit